MREVQNTTHQMGQSGIDAVPVDAVVLDAVFVGNSFAGMYMLYKLREMGFSAWVFERGSDVGSTWY